MKIAVQILSVILIALITGCGGTSTSIEGKVVDGKGKPMAGVKVVAKQVEPIKGDRQFETTTGSDGMFRFKGLSPASKYSIFPEPDRWKTLDKVTARSSGPEGQTIILPSPITIRFTVSNNGLITDSQSGLQWAPAKDKAMNWFQAQSYAQSLSLDGKGWRLPLISELEGIYEPIKNDPGLSFNIQHNWVWTTEIEEDRAWAFNFSYGGNDKLPKGRSDSRFRTLAVRSPK
jgi:hypothetical protein